MSGVVKQRIGEITTDGERALAERMLLLDEMDAAKEAGKFSRRMDAFRAVYEKSDRIISNQDVRVVILQEPGAMAQFPAWTNGTTIWLNGRMLSQTLFGEEMAIWVRQTKALNLHELCHVLYTPRQGSDFIKWIKDVRMYPQEEAEHKARHYIKHAWNILEDQRIETMFVAKYRPAGAYLESMIIKFLLGEEKQWDNAHMLLHGRMYLPTKLRKVVRSRFVDKWGEAMATTAEGIIDQYLYITHPTDNARAKALVVEFATMIKDMLESGDAEAQPQPMVGDHDDNLEGQQPRKEDQNQAQRQIKDIQPRDTEEEDIEEDDGEAGTNDRGGEPADVEEDEGAAGAASDGAEEDTEDEADAAAGADGDREDGSGDRSEQGQAPVAAGAADDGDDAGDDGDATDQQQGAGGGEGQLKPFRDQLEDFQDDLLNDDKFQADVERVGRAIQDVIRDAEMVAEGEDVNADLRPAPTEIIKASRTMEKHLREIKVQLEEQHFRHQMHGQIDPRAYLTRQPWDVDFFRSYDPGVLDEVDVEAVILIDQSTSMSRRMGAVSTALWALKKSLEEIDARVTVLGFSDKCYLMYGPNDRLKGNQMKVFGSRGGTYPDAALTEAYKVLSASDRKVKVMLTLTDGQWFGDEHKQRAVMEAITGLGTITQLQYITSGNAVVDPSFLEKNRHHHGKSVGITTPTDLTKAALDIVRRSMAGNIHHEE